MPRRYLSVLDLYVKDWLRDNKPAQPAKKSVRPAKRAWYPKPWDRNLKLRKELHPTSSVPDGKTLVAARPGESVEGAPQALLAYIARWLPDVSGSQLGRALLTTRSGVEQTVLRRISTYPDDTEAQIAQALSLDPKKTGRILRVLFSEGLAVCEESRWFTPNPLRRAILLSLVNEAAVRRVASRRVRRSSPRTTLTI